MLHACRLHYTFLELVYSLHYVLAFINNSFLSDQLLEKLLVKKKLPKVIGVEILKKNGIDVNKLIKLLVTNASVEFTAYYYFTNLRMHCTGIEGEGIKGIIEDARLEDLSHFESCIERIFQLGGSLPDDAQAFIKMSGCEFLQLPSNPTDLKSILHSSSDIFSLHK